MTDPMSTQEERCVSCTTCGHETPHKRIGPIRDLNGFKHADACEAEGCSCINAPDFRYAEGRGTVVPNIERSPRFTDCATPHPDFLPPADPKAERCEWCPPNVYPRMWHKQREEWVHLVGPGVRSCGIQTAAPDTTAEPSAGEDALHSLDWSRSFDARDWIAPWLQAIRENPSIPADEGAMIGWFANAIMAGYDYRAQNHPAPSTSPDTQRAESPSAELVVERLLLFADAVGDEVEEQLLRDAAAVIARLTAPSADEEEDEKALQAWKDEEDYRADAHGYVAVWRDGDPELIHALWIDAIAYARKRGGRS